MNAITVGPRYGQQTAGLFSECDEYRKLVGDIVSRTAPLNKLDIERSQRTLRSIIGHLYEYYRARILSYDEYCYPPAIAGGMMQMMPAMIQTEEWCPRDCEHRRARQKLRNDSIHELKKIRKRGLEQSTDRMHRNYRRAFAWCADVASPEKQSA